MNIYKKRIIYIKIEYGDSMRSRPSVCSMVFVCTVIRSGFGHIQEYIQDFYYCVWPCNVIVHNNLLVYELIFQWIHIYTYIVYIALNNTRNKNHYFNYDLGKKQSIFSLSRVQWITNSYLYIYIIYLSDTKHVYMCDVHVPWIYIHMCVCVSMFWMQAWQQSRIYSHMIHCFILEHTTYNDMPVRHQYCSLRCI